VLVLSFLSLGWRIGIVFALSVPLVLAIVAPPPDGQTRVRVTRPWKPSRCSVKLLRALATNQTSLLIPSRYVEAHLRGQKINALP
jgi:hypothetical protein